MISRCYLKLGFWQEELQGLTELSIPNILDNYASATFHDPSWYKAWHSWAYMNFETVLFYKNQQDNTHFNEHISEKEMGVKPNLEVKYFIYYLTLKFLKISFLITYIFV